MIDVQLTTEFRRWLRKLSDKQAQTIIGGRIRRLESGNFGDAKPVGNGVSELRIHFGPGYRIYFQRRGHVVILLLCGGDKSTQEQDIKLAIRLSERPLEEDK